MQKPTIGFIGLGLMGAPMAARLLNAGFSANLFNRTKEKAESLIQQGGIWRELPEEAAKNSEIVITMVTNDDALLALSEKIESSLRIGGLHIDCSTVSGSLTDALQREYESRGKFFLHSPVLGSIPQATDGSLLLFAGGCDEAFAKGETVLNILGSKIWKFSKASQASNTKIILNSFIAGMAATISQAFALAKKADVDGTAILEILTHSALNAPMFQTKGTQILQNNFAPRFFLENLLKDTNLMISAGKELNSPTPIAETVRQILEQSIAKGFAKEDYIAMAKAFE